MPAFTDRTLHMQAKQVTGRRVLFLSQIHEQQKQLAAVTAELQASRDQAEQQQRELDRANRSAQCSFAQHSSMQQLQS